MYMYEGKGRKERKEKKSKNRLCDVDEGPSLRGPQQSRSKVSRQSTVSLFQNPGYATDSVCPVCVNR